MALPGGADPPGEVHHHTFGHIHRIHQRRRYHTGRPLDGILARRVSRHRRLMYPPHLK
jgi:hypothetical protein